MINVTKTFFPPLAEYEKQLERLWKNKWLTNNGELYKELTQKLKEYLEVDYIIPMTNGTLPIQIALNAYADQGEVITTPFSYVATTASILWEKCVPVFVDIDPIHLTIDPTKLEAVITPKTTTILATHVYGNPCDVDAIGIIAKKHNLKVIYDAAHCFGVKYKGKSIFNYGDVSTCSFHATKLFHTGEGGALFCRDDATKQEMYYRHNFGHKGHLEFHGLGINAKMSELQAAMGLSMLPYMEMIIKKRKEVCDNYDEHLNFDKLTKLHIREDTEWNYSYYPIIFKSEKDLLLIEKKLNEKDIFPRRYFFPSLERLPYVNGHNCPLAFDISLKVLCLPLYHNLMDSEINLISHIINSNI